MKRFKSLFFLVSELVMGSFLIAVTTAHLAAQQSDPFYISLLEKAQKSFLAKNYEEAARGFDVAAFGLAGDKTLRAKAYVYLSLCKYYLKDLKASEKSLREAAGLMSEEGFASLQIYESAWPDVEKLMIFYNIGPAQNSPLPKEVGKPVSTVPEPSPSAKPNEPKKKPEEKGTKETNPGGQPVKTAQDPPKSDLKLDEIKEGDILPLDLVDTPPVAVKRVPAAYPPNAVAWAIEGTVIINILISEKGDVIKTEIVRGMKEAFGFDQAAQRAVRQWKFEPASIRGMRVKVWIPVAIEFKKEPGL